VAPRRSVAPEDTLTLFLKIGRRSWPGWHHHVTLVSVAHGFLTLERLRRPKLVASA
jgi:SRSO17 transposase